MSLTKRFRWRKVTFDGRLFYNLAIVVPSHGRKCAIDVEVTPHDERQAIAQRIKHARSVLRKAVNEWEAR